jgi:hypothetical protein
MDGVGVGMAIAAILVTGWIMKIDRPHHGTGQDTEPPTRDVHDVSG